MGSDVEDLETVRRGLRLAANVKDPREMWYVVRELFNLLTLIVTGEALTFPVEAVEGPGAGEERRVGPG